jgi:Sec-independent protein secretion pathway component TatC
VKIKIIADDGSVQGWFVSFLITFLRLGVYIASYVSPELANVEVKIGAGFTTFSLASVGSWFAYKIVKPLTESKNP